jgi:hypothetical protein
VGFGDWDSDGNAQLKLAETALACCSDGSDGHLCGNGPLRFEGTYKSMQVVLSSHVMFAMCSSLATDFWLLRSLPSHLLGCNCFK